ncbi:Wall-associated receptor kinase 3 [Ananas comosus]|uniref:Wall-associated receptor kinase 3 n=2 Tax=Ananas comosus TaxID=4615 RepID=A0A199ULF2_ANACO|nr:Wall-associated receptor kinase 3 [Ananas comosus]
MHIPPLFNFLHLVWLLVPASSSSPDSVDPSALGMDAPSCNFDFPFGAPGFSQYRKGFEVSCNPSLSGSPSWLQVGSKKLQIMNISIAEGYVRTGITPSTWQCSRSGETGEGISLEGTPFTFSHTRNKLTVVSCDTFVSFADHRNSSVSVGCVSFCPSQLSITDGACSGVGCCQAAIPVGLKSFDAQFYSIPDEIKRRWKLKVNNTLQPMTASSSGPQRKEAPSIVFENTTPLCSKVFIAEYENFTFSKRYLEISGDWEDAPLSMVLDWAIGNETCVDARRRNASDYACIDENSSCYDSPDGVGYRCNCSEGYQGNPYVAGGCQAVGLSAMILIFLGSLWIYWLLKKLRLGRLKRQYFMQNGGLLLQQRITSARRATARIFTIEELERATNGFSKDRVIGHGGYGTVYKGILPNDQIIAIKRSKLVDEIQIESFINEVAILSQIDHKNVVKLLGCCLESQVPLLVYEFISNGTLFRHIHEKPNNVIPWEARLRIAAETATALAHLHSRASVPIIHRDVKSANILLDESYTAKVADFGASRLVPYDRTHVTTLVQGTLGYLDPEYFYTSRLTERSDVYSFGVVLVELLTAEKPVSFCRTETETNLASHFVMLLQGKRLWEVADSRMVAEAGETQMLPVADLARRCLSVKGEERPTMEEVAVELDALLRLMKQHLALRRSLQDGARPLAKPLAINDNNTIDEVGAERVCEGG